MTKNIFKSAILAAIRSSETFDKNVEKAQDSKWLRDRKAMERIFLTALKQVTAGASRTSILGALKAGFKDAIQAAPDQESEMKAFRPPVLRAIEALDFETATPETVAEFVNGFETQSAWRVFWRKSQTSEEGEESSEESSETTDETTDAQILVSILNLLAGAKDRPAMIAAINDSAA